MNILFTYPYLGTFIIAWFITDLIIPVIMTIDTRIGIMDFPSPIKLQAKPMPILGGVGIFIGFLVAVLSTLEYNTIILSVTSAAAIIVVLGTVDDIKPISAIFKLLVLVLASLIIIYFGIYLSIIPDYFTAILVTIIWIAGITSTLNAIDNMDGQAGGVACIAAFMFFWQAMLTDQIWLAYISISLAGACLGFLRYNFPPAKIFMGDSGSFFLGFILATLAVLGTWSENSIQSAMFPLLILGVPLFDFALINFARLRNKKIKSIKDAIVFSAKDHFSHRLMSLGFTQVQVALIIYSMAAILGLSAIFITTLPIGWSIVFFVTVVLGLILFGWEMSKVKIKYEEPKMVLMLERELEKEMNK